MTKSYKNILYILFLAAAITSCSKPAKYDRPRDTWAFRSVLDQKPRMFTLALHKNLYVSYDLQSGKLYKAWNGDVNFDGAVYTTAHGIQPSSEGFPFIEDPSDDIMWRCTIGTETVVPSVKYLRYTKINGQAAIDYKLTSGMNSLTIREIPEYDSAKNGFGLVRSFKILEKEGNITPHLLIPNTNINSYEIKGGEISKEDGLIKLTINQSEAVYSVIFDAPPADWKPETDEPVSRIEKGKKLAEQSDCKTCHLVNENLVGPAYDSIAKRYPFSQSVVVSLGNKIIKGGSGNWGEIMMTAHDIPGSDANDMAYYILSLDGESEPDNEDNIFLGEETVYFELDDTDRTSEKYKEKSGLIVDLYAYEETPKLQTGVMAGESPILNAIAPAIHITGSDSIFRLNPSNYFAEYKGNIKVEKGGKKYFRIISDDGSRLLINGKEVIENGGHHAPSPKDGNVVLKKGNNRLLIQHFNGGGGYALSLQWSVDGVNYEVVPKEAFSHQAKDFSKVFPFASKAQLERYIPGDQSPLNAVHPSFDLFDAKPSEFHPRIGGIDFISKDEMVICTWDSAGSVYILKNYNTEDPETIEVKQIASGLAEPLGIKYIDGELFVLQKQELTQLIDLDGDQIIDEYKNICSSWHTTSHYHEFAFGLVFKDGSFYATLATDLGEQYKNVPDRGKVIRISKDGSETEFIARGFRTPNGISEGPDGALYVSDNQGNWIPTSKIVRVEKGGFYGFKFADHDEVKDMEEDPPLVWLPHVEISNSPSEQAILNIGPYKDQMIHGDVTHGGIKRVFIDEVDGVKQGVAFRFIQGLDAGINRLEWGPDGDLYAGGVGSGGNWRHEGRLWYALHRLSYNEKSTFEMLAVRAKSNGMEIELTEPISNSITLTPEDFESQQYYYVATSQYGGPKKGVEDIDIKSVSLSEDRKKIFLEMNEMREGHVIYIHIKSPFISKNRNSLWSTEAWYTLNKRPENDPGFKNIVQIKHNTLTGEEKNEGWQLLFDGKTTKNWSSFNKDDVNPQWVITNNGELHLTGRGGGDIVTDKEYENFELTLEWKLEKGGNSGLMFNVVEDPKYKYPWQTGPEMQMLDDARHPDGRNKTHNSADLYDMVAANPVTANEGGQWNTIRLIINNGKVEHWQNGYKVVEYEMFGEKWKEMIANSKFRNMEDFGVAKKGKIAIQDHGNKLWLRNIKIREL